MIIAPAGFEHEARLWTLHGMSRDAYTRFTAEESWSYEALRPGFKYNMTDLQAPIALQQLMRLRALEEYRRSVSLPLHPRMTDGDVDDVIAAVRDIVTSWHR